MASRPIETTARLVQVIERALPPVARKRGGHPAKRVFQALRIEVNEELDVLAAGLGAALDMLAPGGRCVVLSYHSGEDRLVKQCFLARRERGLPVPPRPSLCMRSRRDRPHSHPGRASRRARRSRPATRGRQVPACARRSASARGGTDGHPGTGCLDWGPGRAGARTGPRPRPRPELDVVDRRRAAARSSRRKASTLRGLGVMFVVGAMAVTAAAHTFVASYQERIDTVQGQLTADTC